MLRDRNVVMLLALGAGLLWGDGARWVEPAAIPALAVIMTIATINVKWGAFISVRAVLAPALTGIALTFVVQAFFMAGAAALFVTNDAFRSGFFILASVPPAVAVIPFTMFVKGDTAFSLAGTIGAYLGALAIAPLMMVALLGSGFIHPLRILIMFGELIVAPLILARILASTAIPARTGKYYGAVTNWGFFIIIYTMVGLNRAVFLDHPLSILPVCYIAFATTFLVGLLIELTGKFFRVPSGVLASAVLLGTFKNYSLAGGIALVFFTPETMVPATVSSVIAILYIVWLELRAKRRPPDPAAAGR
jgi:BASS family bile acid:Na+ symporter